MSLINAGLGLLGIGGGGGGSTGFFIPGEITDFFERAYDLLEFLVKITKLMLAVVDELLSEENYNKILNVIKKVIRAFLDNFGVVIEGIIDGIIFVIDNIDEFTQNIFDLISVIFEFIVGCINNLIKFLEILPRLLMNSVEFGIKNMEIANYIMYFIPMFLIFYLAVMAVNRIEQKKINN